MSEYLEFAWSASLHVGGVCEMGNVELITETCAFFSSTFDTRDVLVVFCDAFGCRPDFSVYSLIVSHVKPTPGSGMLQVANRLDFLSLE